MAKAILPTLLRGSWACGARLALSACGALDNDDPTFYLRGVNLITDSPTVKFYLGETQVASAGYNGGSSWQAGEAGTFNLNFKVVHPGNLNDDDEDDAEETAIGTTISQAFAEDKDYTVFAYGTLADPKIFMMEGTGQRDTPDDNKLIFQVANVAPNAPSVDVYVTAPQAGIDTATLVATLTPGQYSDPQTLEVEQDPDVLDEDATRTTDVTFELRDTASGQTLYTSTTLTANEQSRVVMAVAENAGGVGPSPVKLLQIGSDGTTTQFLEPDDNARVRFVNMSKDSPPLDVVVNTFQNPIAQAVGFRGQSPHTELVTGERGLIATVSGDPSNFAFIEEFTATGDQSYTAYAIGTGTDLDAYVIAEDPRSVPTQAKFRFLLAAPSLEDELLDIYVMASGKTIDFPANDDDTEYTSPSFSSNVFTGTTSYLTLEGAGYDIYFVTAGTDDVIAGPIPLNIPNGANQTLVLTENESGSLEMIPISDTTT
jgi:hypothetical protein